MIFTLTLSSVVSLTIYHVSPYPYTCMCQVTAEFTEITTLQVRVLLLANVPNEILFLDNVWISGTPKWST